MKKTITINNQNFELINNELYFYQVVNNFGYAGRTLYDCYTRPSKTKEEIYKHWMTWFNELKTEEVDWEYTYRIGVKSYNCNFFSLHAYFKYMGSWYYVEITAHHNRAWKLTF